MTEHQAGVLRWLREFMPDGWRLELTKRHEGSHAVLTRMADAGLVAITKEPDAWTYKAEPQ